MKKEYRSAIRSRRLIREAFYELMQHKDISKITVTEIVNLADINRATFYAHYPDVRGVIEEIENEIIVEMLDILKDLNYKNFFDNPVPLLLQVSRILEDNESIYKILICSTGSETFISKLQNIFSDYMQNDVAIPEVIRTSKSYKLRVYYFAGGIVNMYRNWFNGNLDCPLNDIPLEIGKMIASASKEMLK